MGKEVKIKTKLPTLYYIKTIGKPYYVHCTDEETRSYQMKEGKFRAVMFKKENALNFIKATGAENLMIKKVKR